MNFLRGFRDVYIMTLCIFFALYVFLGALAGSPYPSEWGGYKTVWGVLGFIVSLINAFFYALNSTKVHVNEKDNSQ